MIIDDEPAIVEQIEQCASEYFALVLTANTIEEGKEYLESYTVDCVVVDIDIKGRNGGEIVKLLKEENPNDNMDASLIIISGHINDDFKKKFKDRVSGIISKPFSLEEMENEFLKVTVDF